MIWLTRISSAAALSNGLADAVARFWPAHRVGTMINNMQRAVVLHVLPPLPDRIEVNDPNDAFLLAMALASEADYLVTGDRRAGLLQRGSIGRTRIVTPVTFCAEAL
ncbi:hypothetical protein CFN58_08235 [Pseudomonas avellanae]|uniref:PIN domain-containing protein n=1 Tax=Pseudomonas avellanae TaxID=46257 RepID=A0A261WLI4_9PSED|nr:hypothetical protein CFN58_08235 [Pseudomonas avellanae]